MGVRGVGDYFHLHSLSLSAHSLSLLLSLKTPPRPQNFKNQPPSNLSIMLLSSNFVGQARRRVFRDFDKFGARARSKPLGFRSLTRGRDFFTSLICICVDYGVKDWSLALFLVQIAT